MNNQRTDGHTVKAATLVALAMLLFAFSGSSVADEKNTGVTRVNLDFTKVTVAKNEDGVAEFSGAEVANEPGSPGMPTVVTRVLLPPNADLRSAKVEMEESKQSRLPGKWDVIPRAAVAPVGGQAVWPKGARMERGMNLNVYEKDAYQPSSFIGLVKGQPFAEWRVLLVRMSPYRYNPVTRQLQRLENCTLKVSYDRDAETKRIKRDTSGRGMRRRVQLKKNVANFTTAANEYDQLRK